MNRTRLIKLIKKLTVIIVITWSIFAAIPEVFNFSPLPTGGWDWLSFVGVILATMFALEGVIMTIENENEINRKLEEKQNEVMMHQNQLSVIPCLDVPIIEIVNCLYDKIYIFREFEQYKESLINHGFEIKKLQNIAEKVKSIKVRNIGLSTAFSVNTYIYKLENVRGLESLNEIRKRNIDKFYEKIQTSNYEYKEDGEVLKDEWQIFTTFNLSIDDRSEINFVFKFNKIKSEFHNIIEFRFNDIYENEYYQLLYLYFDDIEIKLLPISKVYKGKSHKSLNE